MKTLHTALLASSFLVATYVAASAPAHAGGKRCAALTVEPPRAERQTNFDTDVAIDVARHGLPVRTEVEALQTSVSVEELTYVGLPDQCVLQFMLAQELNQLHALAMMFMVHEAELRQAQLELVLGRFERTVTQVDQAWSRGDVADDLAIQSLTTMRVDAFDYIESLGVSSIRERLEEAMAALIVRGTDAMHRVEAVHDTFKTLYELRLEVSLVVLEAHLADGKFTKLDYQRVETAVRGLEHLQHSTVPFDCAS